MVVIEITSHAFDPAQGRPNPFSMKEGGTRPLPLDGGELDRGVILGKVVLETSRLFYHSDSALQGLYLSARMKPNSVTSVLLWGVIKAVTPHS